MSFAPIHCNCFKLCSERFSTSSEDSKSQSETHDSDSALGSEDQWAPTLGFQNSQNTIVNCIQRAVYGHDTFFNIFTQLNLVCSDDLCVFKINPDALKKLVSGNFIEENGLTTEIRDNFEEMQRKRTFPKKTGCVENKKMKFSGNLGVIGDRSGKIYVKMTFDEEKITENETLARITWDVSKRCSAHKEPLYFVCEICNRTICSKCIVENHQGHRIVPKNTESAYATAKKVQVCIGNYIKDIENLLWQIEIILKEIPFCAQETAQCVMELLDSWEYQGSCIHRRHYLLKLIDTIKTLKIRDLKLQQQNLNQFLFRMELNLKTLRESLFGENISTVTYASMTAREDLELAKNFDYGFVPIHNKEFRIALKAKNIKRPAALTVISATVVDPMKKMALKKIPFEDSERFSKMNKKKAGFGDVKINLSKRTWYFGEEGNGKGQLCRPWGIACDKNGRFFVSDRSNNRIQVFNSDGTYGFSFGKFGYGEGELNRPAGVAIDIFNRVIVSDKDNHRIQVFTLNGEYIFHFGGMGNLPGRFNYPWDICTNIQGEIAVSDTKNRRIQLFTKKGCLNGVIYFYPYDLKFFDLPRAVKFNSQGELVVGDFNNHRFIVFDQVYSSFKMYGCEGQFNRPQGLFIDAEGNHLVADSKNSCVAIYDKNFKPLKEIKHEMFKNPQGVCLTPNGNIAVVDMEYHRIVIL